MIEHFIASVVSQFLSVTGVSAVADSSFIHVPSLNHTFLVTLSCASWIVILLQAFMYAFVMWVYATVKGLLLTRRTYLVLGFVGFLSFFFINIVRIVTEIYLVGKVYYPVATYYLLSWQAFEEQVGMGLMFATLITLWLLSVTVFKCRMKMQPSLPLTDTHIEAAS